MPKGVSAECHPFPEGCQNQTTSIFLLTFKTCSSLWWWLTAKQGLIRDCGWDKKKEIPVSIAHCSLVGNLDSSRQCSNEINSVTCHGKIIYMLVKWDPGGNEMFKILWLNWNIFNLSIWMLISVQCLTIFFQPAKIISNTSIRAWILQGKKNWQPVSVSL